MQHKCEATLWLTSPLSHCVRTHVWFKHFSTCVWTACTHLLLCLGLFKHCNALVSALQELRAAIAGLYKGVRPEEVLVCAPEEGMHLAFGLQARHATTCCRAVPCSQSASHVCLMHSFHVMLLLM